MPKLAVRSGKAAQARRPDTGPVVMAHPPSSPTDEESDGRVPKVAEEQVKKAWPAG